MSVGEADAARGLGNVVVSLFPPAYLSLCLLLVA